MRIRPTLLAAPLIPYLLAGHTASRPVTSRKTSDLTLTVVVVGATADGGAIAAALYASPDGFPGKVAKAAKVSQHPRTAAVDSFVFRGLAPGQYAVSVYHDLNSNGKLDANLFGVPKEPWGTSASVRPSLRAPRFEEGRIDLTTSTRIEIRVER